MAKFSFHKIILLLFAITGGILGILFIPINNKDIVGWLIGAFTAFGGLLIAVMTLAGHSLTLLQDNDWKSLQFFKETYSTRIHFSALVSFWLLLSVCFLIINYLYSNSALSILTGFISGVSFIYILFIPFYLSKMYIEYYDYIIEKQKKQTHSSKDNKSKKTLQKITKQRTKSGKKST